MATRRWARRAKLATCFVLMFVGSVMVLGHAYKALLWTAILWAFIWLGTRIPPEDRHTKP